MQNACAGLFLDPGLGKTSISLAAIKILLKEKLIGKVLIVAPMRVCYLVWPKEIEKWEDFKNLRVKVLHGKHKERDLLEDADIYLINPEGLGWLFGKKNFKKLGFDVLIIDESSKFKSTNTDRFRTLRQQLNGFSRRYILTGSPAPNGLMDVFAQIYILDMGAALGAFITHFRNTYFNPTGFGGFDWKLQEGAAEKIQDKIKPLVLRLEAKDYLELPEIVVQRVEVELDATTRKIYNEMEKDLITQINKGVVVASTAAVASSKCRQIANGGMYGEDKEVHHLHDLKAQAVADLVQELGGAPALIAYEFEHDLQRLLKVLGKNTPYMGGGVSDKKAAAIEEAWNKGQLPVLLGHPASIGHGLNLQGAGNHVIWHSPTWNYEFYDQFNKRVARQGAAFKQVFVHHVVALNTVDEAVLGALRYKQRTQNDFLLSLKDYAVQKNNLESPQKQLYNSSVNMHNDHIRDTPNRRGGSREITEVITMSEEKPNKFAAKKSAAVTVDTKKKKIVAAPVAKTKKEKIVDAVKQAEARPVKKAKNGEKTTVRGEFDSMKIKVINKNHGAREGTARAEIFDAIISSKTVAEAKSKDEKVNNTAVRIMEEKGFITLAA